MRQTLTIWCNQSLNEASMQELRAETKGHQLLLENAGITNLKAGEPSELMSKADIAFGQPHVAQSASLASLRWIHLTSAGYTLYDSPEFRQAVTARGATLTNSSSVYDEPCAQHLLAFMLSFARRLPHCAHEQTDGYWAYERLRDKVRVLEDETVLILGYGAIGRRLAQLLAPFRLKIHGVRRAPKADEYAEVHSLDRLGDLLPAVDHIVNILPASPSTAGFVNEDFIQRTKPGAILYNVGRGSTVDQPALRAALLDERLSAAYLDVTDPEPLPADHFLWTTPNCFISPHIAGGRQEEHEHLVRHFVRNLRRFEAGEPLIDVVI